jgi:hypothetical protein
MTWLRQMAAVAHTEFRLGLRRGGLVIGTAAVGLIVTSGTLFFASTDVEGMPRHFAAKAGAQGLAMVWPVFEWLALGLLPIVSAPAIPSDRQSGAGETLRSLPLTGGVYLSGKVLGTLATVLPTAAVALTLHFLLHLVLLGPIGTRVLLELTFLSGLPLLLWASTMGVLVGCLLQTRRAAILIGVVVGMAGPLMWTMPFGAAAGPSQWATGDANRLIYQAISRFVLERYDLLPAYIPHSLQTGMQALQSIIIALFVLAGAATVARLWLKWKENF